MLIEKLHIDVEVYFASEVKETAIRVSKMHFGKIRKPLPDVRSITSEDIKDCGRIDLLIATPPCGDLSIAGLKRGLHGMIVFFLSRKSHHKKSIFPHCNF